MAQPNTAFKVSLELYATAAFDLGAGSAWSGDADEVNFSVREFLNRLVDETPGRRILHRDNPGQHLRSLALPEENHHGQGSAEAFSALSLQEPKDYLPGKPKQCYPSEGAASHTVPRGRYARSKAGWVSKERSTPEGYNRQEHSCRFESLYLPGMSPSSMVRAYRANFKAPVVVRPPQVKKSPEERSAIRERKIMQNERASLHHVQTALHKYNRANTTTFEVDEITVKCLFFEFGGPCYYYNFTAKPDNHPSAGGSTNRFFAEINCPLQSEDDVLVCCIIGEKYAGHCHACENYRPMMVHPSSRTYGGGNTTAIDYPDEDSSSSDNDF